MRNTLLTAANWQPASRETPAKIVVVESDRFASGRGQGLICIIIERVIRSDQNLFPDCVKIQNVHCPLMTLRCASEPDSFIESAMLQVVVDKNHGVPKGKNATVAHAGNKNIAHPWRRDMACSASATRADGDRDGFLRAVLTGTWRLNGHSQGIGGAGRLRLRRQNLLEAITFNSELSRIDFEQPINCCVCGRDGQDLSYKDSLPHARLQYSSPSLQFSQLASSENADEEIKNSTHSERLMLITGRSSCGGALLNDTLQDLVQSRGQQI